MLAGVPRSRTPGTLTKSVVTVELFCVFGWQNPTTHADERCGHGQPFLVTRSKACVPSGVSFRSPGVQLGATMNLRLIVMLGHLGQHTTATGFITSFRPAEL